MMKYFMFYYRHWHLEKYHKRLLKKKKKYVELCRSRMINIYDRRMEFSKLFSY